LHKLFQATNERCPAIGAHLEKERMNAIDKLLVRLLASGAACSGKLHKDLSPVFAAAPTFYQSPLFQAVNGANHSRRVNAQMSSNTTNSARLPGGLSVVNQSENDELGHAKALPMRVLETRTENSAQIQEQGGK
jgi:hypothetical protein